MKLQVDQTQRLAKKRAHSGAHLLHSQLVNFFPDTQQAGSYVDQDYLRLDFQADEPLNDNQIQDLESGVNDIIYQSISVSKKEMSLQEAKDMGATALFEDKYGEQVRVIKMGDVSIELCGGTHVDDTSQIGAFKIVGQTSVSSGVRRLQAVTGPKVYEYFNKTESKLKEIANQLEAPVNQVHDTLRKTLEEYEQTKQKLEGLKDSLIVDKLRGLDIDEQKPFDKIINVSQDSFFEKIDFKSIAHKAKGEFDQGDILIYNNDGNFVIVANSKWDANGYASEKGLRGGGSSDFVQGKDEYIPDQFNS